MQKKNFQNKSMQITIFTDQKSKAQAQLLNAKWITKLRSGRRAGKSCKPAYKLSNNIFDYRKILFHLTCFASSMNLLRPKRSSSFSNCTGPSL